MSWRILAPRPDEDAKAEKLQKHFDIHPMVARLLIRRGFEDTDAADRFLNGTVAHLPNPFALPDMDAAVGRLLEAVANKEKIAVFGDYDVDGMTGTAQLCAYFREIGHPVHPLLPHRIRDGYGLTEKSVRRIAAEKPSLLVTVDNGTKSAAEIGHLKNLGIETIVIDHHETPTADSWPPVAALVNPKRMDSSFGERDIASAGLVFLLLMALRARARERGLPQLPNLKRYLDLACLGTIADVVPLTGTNRLIAKYGLEELGSTSRAGLKALSLSAQIAPPVSVTNVAFRIAPRLNAAGRLADPKISLDLLLSEKNEEAYALAERLEALNRERQSVEERVTKEAIRQIEETQAGRKGIVAAGKDWHLGVVGIVAAKLVERFETPAIALAISEDGLEAKGSARSLRNVSVYEPLKKIERLMLRFGGHAAAAGMTIAADRISEFTEAFHQAVSESLEQNPAPSLDIDAPLSLTQINGPLVGDLARLEPFGPGNWEPVFLASGVSFEGCRIVGNSGARGHLKALACQKGTRIDSIGFDWGTYLPTAQKYPCHEIAFTPEINEWNGRKSLQLKIKSIKPNH